MMMPTTLATMSRKESKLKGISRARRRRRIMVSVHLRPHLPGPGSHGSSVCAGPPRQGKPGDRSAAHPVVLGTESWDDKAARQHGPWPGVERSAAESFPAGDSYHSVLWKVRPW